jgi:hypothetical protein
MTTPLIIRWEYRQLHVDPGERIEDELNTLGTENFDCYHVAVGVYNVNGRTETHFFKRPVYAKQSEAAPPRQGIRQGMFKRLDDGSWGALILGSAQPRKGEFVDLRKKDGSVVERRVSHSIEGTRDGWIVALANANSANAPLDYHPPDHDDFDPADDDIPV